MDWLNPILNITLEAGAGVVENRFVRVETGGKAFLGATSVPVFGVAVARTTGHPSTVTVCVYGVAPVLAAEAISAGDVVTSAHLGRARKYTGTEPDNVGIAGIALESARAGELVPILLTLPGLKLPG